MFIYSVKAQNIKLYFSIALSVLAVVLVAVFIPARNGQILSQEEIPVAKTISKNDFKNIESNEDRLDFLKLYGWDVDENPTEITEITIPVEFDPIYKKYNEIQKNEGLDLEKFKGKTVKKYTYLVNNYEYDGTVFANLLIYRDRVIGGDISSIELDGFMHGFSYPQESNY
jgi:hypothetical protein